MAANLPYATHSIAGIGGQIKQDLEDFRVLEIPAYPCSGQGEHLFLYIEKTGITTFDLLQQLARQLNLPVNSIGYAGIKDCHAVTSQYFSVPLSVKDKLDQISLYHAKILSIQQHINKLRIGHLKGNQFEILIRNPHPEWKERIQEISKILAERGVPNYYGPQRFGNQNNTQLLGKFILRKDTTSVLHTFFGEIHADDTPLFQTIKEQFAQKKYREAYQLIPPSMVTEKYLLKLITNGMPLDQAVGRIPKKMRNFYISAYQSDLFNRSLANRIHEFDQIWPGDLAMKHPGQAVFVVSDLSTEQERCRHQEISPSGPIFGYKILMAQGKQGEEEQKILADEQLDLAYFRPFHYKGERRSYRFFAQISWQSVPQGILVSLILPKGCYATVVLAEIMKKDLSQPELWEDDESESDED